MFKFSRGINYQLFNERLLSLDVLIYFTQQRKLLLYCGKMLLSGKVYYPIESIPVWHKSLLDLIKYFFCELHPFLVAVALLCFIFSAVPSFV